MATFSGVELIPGFDENGQPCLFNTANGSRVYGPVVVPGHATATPINPATGLAVESNWKHAVSGAWTEYKAVQADGKKKSYWHNPMSGETTWEKPDMNPGKPTAPQPPPPPAKGAEPKKPASDTESDKNLWKQERDGKGRKYWYHETTGQSQYETPHSLRK